jgi:hypothetical protein
MKWNWIKDGGPLPTEYENVLCYCVDTDYLFVGYIRPKWGWAVTHDDDDTNPPDAWCRIETPPLPNEVK